MYSTVTHKEIDASFNCDESDRLMGLLLAPAAFSGAVGFLVLGLTG